MLVEVLFLNHIAGHHIGDVAEYDPQTILFNALLNGKHVEIINPPDYYWSPEEKVTSNGSHNYQTGPDTEPRERPGDSADTSGHSSAGVGGGETTGSEGHGGTGKLPVGGKNNGPRKTSRKSGLLGSSNPPDS